SLVPRRQEAEDPLRVLVGADVGALVPRLPGRAVGMAQHRPLRHGLPDAVDQREPTFRRELGQGLAAVAAVAAVARQLAAIALVVLGVLVAVVAEALRRRGCGQQRAAPEQEPQTLHLALPRPGGAGRSQGLL